ncbi:MAG: class I SAM-dependent methyltransferase [Deltaproteobacteria bacterium]|nr:class I SAM-dependent methyltransferase [Deltaproteobacteria bacterium]
MADRFVWGSFDDSPIVLKALEQSTGPLLELGCGTGRALEVPLKKGYNVIGIDHSKDMLAVAKERFKTYNNLRLLLGDVTQMQYPGFGTVAMLLNTYSVFTDAQVRLDILKRVAVSMNDSGNAVFILKNDNEAGRKSSTREEVSEIEAGKKLHYQGAAEYDPRTGIRTLRLKFRFGDENEHHIIPTILFSVEQFAREAALAGLVVSELYGDFDLSPYHREQSPWQIYLLTHQK